jgi:tRNA(adenine34) deaminase
MTDYELMGLALEQAARAAALGEVPIGAVVARRGEVIAAAHNTRETEKNALHHAELLAIDAACRALGGWRLWECELFVTLEPCPMCSGGIINSRIRRVVYGAADPKAGCCGSVTDLFAMPFNHHPVVESGLRADEAQALLQAFFARLRQPPQVDAADGAAGNTRRRTGCPGAKRLSVLFIGYRIKDIFYTRKPRNRRNLA